MTRSLDPNVQILCTAQTPSIMPYGRVWHCAFWMLVSACAVCIPVLPVVQYITDHISTMTSCFSQPQQNSNSDPA